MMGRELAIERFKTRGPELAKQLLKANKQDRAERRAEKNEEDDE